VDDLERKACTPIAVSQPGFNPAAQIPYGCTPEHIRQAMREFTDFLGFMNNQLYSKEIARFETMLMPANFSSLVGEFMNTAIPKYSRGLVKNQYHNGHPDLLPAGLFPNDAAQYASVGIEVKASRYVRGWQGHNPENVWLMVFVFDSNRPVDASKGITPKPFRFVMVVGAQLEVADWLYAGRSETSRRTITASVTKSGYEKLLANWIYKDPELFQPER
jgi:hypothetical protein